MDELARQVSTGVDQVVDTGDAEEAESQVTNAERLWILCSQALRAQVTEATWRAWFEGVVPIEGDDEGEPPDSARARAAG